MPPTPNAHPGVARDKGWRMGIMTDDGGAMPPTPHTKCVFAEAPAGTAPGEVLPLLPCSTGCYCVWCCARHRVNADPDPAISPL